jgi:hypothetical protein
MDGMDELKPVDGKSLITIHEEITSVLGVVAAGLPQNARLLIFSRPEHAILGTLVDIPLDIECHDLTPKDSLLDVQLYFEYELPKLGKRHGQRDFPSPQQLKILCTTAAGHIGWAAQVFRWLESYLQRHTGAKLGEQIEKIGELAQGDLDGLYRLILDHCLEFLASAEHPDRPSFTREFQKVLRCLAILEHPLCIESICQLVKPDGNDFDVFNCLRQLSSLYASGTEVETIVKPHKSFYDFITSDRAKAFVFHADREIAHHELASSCFRIMQHHFYFNQQPYPEAVHQYVGFNLGHHVVNSPRQLLVPDILSWARRSFFSWLEVVFIVDNGGITQLEKLKRYCGVSCPLDFP